MRATFIPHLRENAIAYLALFLALSSGAYAAGLGRNSVKSKQIKDGAVRTNDIADGAVSTAKIEDGAVRGQEVADGTLTQADFAAGQISSWAVVGSDATLVQGSGATGVTRVGAIGNGAYEVNFGRDVTNCALIATIGRTDSQALNPDSGQIGTAYRNANPSGVFVKTRDATGSAADRSFHLAAIC